MLTILLLLALGFGSGKLIDYLINAKKERESYEKNFYTVFFSTVLGILGLIFAVFGSAWLPSTPVETERLKIVSLYEDKELFGRFFLGSGFINTKPVYHFRYETKTIMGENGYSWSYAVRGEADEVELPKDSKEGYIQYYGYKYTYWWCWMFAIAPNPDEGKPVIYYPSGSVDNNFSLKVTPPQE